MTVVIFAFVSIGHHIPSTESSTFAVTTKSLLSSSESRKPTMSSEFRTEQTTGQYLSTSEPATAVQTVSIIDQVTANDPRSNEFTGNIGICNTYPPPFPRIESFRYFVMSDQR